jgi:5-methylcytosine-specific restriction endonuclease McrA
LARQRLYRKNNRESDLANARRRRSENIEKARERDRLFEARHPERARIRNHRRRARKMAAGGTFTKEDVAKIKAGQTDKRGRLICWYCGNPIKGTYHIDHFIPLAIGGTNDPGNLRLACPKCNHQKYAKHPIELGRLI